MCVLCVLCMLCVRDVIHSVCVCVHTRTHEIKYVVSVHLYVCVLAFDFDLVLKQLTSAWCLLVLLEVCVGWTDAASAGHLEEVY